MSFPAPGQGPQQPQAPVQFDFKASWESSKTRWVLLAGASAVVSAISVFLPWITATIELYGFKETKTVNGFAGSGKIGIIIAVAVVALAVVGLLMNNVRATPWFSSVLSSLTGVLVILPIYEFIDVAKGTRELKRIAGDGALVSIHIGLWLFLLAGVAAAAFGTINLMVEKGKLAPNFGGAKPAPGAMNPMGAGPQVPLTPFTAQKPQAPGYPMPGQPVPGQQFPGQPVPGVAPQQGFPQAPTQGFPSVPGTAPQAPQQPQPPVNPQG